MPRREVFNFIFPTITRLLVAANKLIDFVKAIDSAGIGGGDVEFDRDYIKLLEDVRMEGQIQMTVDVPADVMADGLYENAVPEYTGELKRSLKGDASSAAGVITGRYLMDPVRNGEHYAQEIDLFHPSKRGFSEIVRKIIIERVREAIRREFAKNGVELK